MKSQTPSAMREDRDDSNSRSETLEEYKTKFENTYKMKPDFLLSGNVIRNTMKQVVNEMIAGEKEDFLDTEGRGYICTKLTDDIRQRIKIVYANTRYKFIIHVTIVQDFATFSIGSRCLWNENTDNHMTVSIPFGDSYIVSTCYSVYFE